MRRQMEWEQLESTRPGDDAEAQNLNETVNFRCSQQWTKENAGETLYNGKTA
jgi:hypothetical protein